MKSFIVSIIKSKFTVKMLLLSIVPIFLYSLVSISFVLYELISLNEHSSQIIKNDTNKIYMSILQDKNTHIKEKVSLKLNSIISELNILRAGAQSIIDNKTENVKPDDWIEKNMVYNEEGNWSNLSPNKFNLSMSVWGYLHNDDGSIKKETMEYASTMFPIKTLMQTIGEHGVDKEWFYLVGPKEMPIVIMTPWAQVSELMSEVYPKHNENNFWDFFFPGIIETWNRWILDDFTYKHTDDFITYTPLYKDAGGKGLMFTIFEPLWNKKRTRNYGAVAVDYNTKNIFSIVSDERIGEEGFSFLIKSNGDILDAENNILKKLELTVNEKANSVIEIYNLNLSKSKIKGLALLKDKIGSIDKFTLFEFSNKSGEEYFISIDKLSNHKLWNGSSDILPGALYIATVISKKEV